MNYRVVWPKETLDELAAAWLAAADRDAVTAASHEIDQALGQDPYACGFRRNSSVNRTLVDYPLGVEYEIIEDDKKVHVVRVWSVV